MPQVNLPDADNGTVDRIKQELGEEDDTVAVRSALRISERVLREIGDGGTLLVKSPTGHMRRLFLKPRGRW